MKIHNITQELILKKVHKIFEEEINKETQDFCTSHRCELDVACYVLNRSKPHYLISERGIAHKDLDYKGVLQREVDISILIQEAIDTVSNTLRPNQDETAKEELEISKPYYSFPTLMGRLFNGVNFEPMNDISITLKHDNKIIPMIDHDWHNPYRLIKNTSGTYLFWPGPIEAPEDGMTNKFTFELSVDVRGYNPLQHFFDIEVTSTTGYNDTFSQSHSYKIQDLYIFPQ